MSDTGDEDFKSLFDDDFDKTKGRKSAGYRQVYKEKVLESLFTIQSKRKLLVLALYSKLGQKIAKTSNRFYCN